MDRAYLEAERAAHTHYVVPATGEKRCCLCLSIWPCEQSESLDLALRAEGYRKALVEQGLLQKTASGSMVWHAHDCPASFDFDECNYRCRVAREAFAPAGMAPSDGQDENLA